MYSVQFFHEVLKQALGQIDDKPVFTEFIEMLAMIIKVEDMIVSDLLFAAEYVKFVIDVLRDERLNQ